MTEAFFYLASSFWLGAVHAATPGHGKTIAAAYIVGVRGKPVDAWVLGIFVTLSHTSGIVLVGVLASLGMPGMIPQRIEAWLAAATGLLIVLIGAWTLWTQRGLFAAAKGSAAGQTHAHESSGKHAHSHSNDHAHTHSHGLSDGHPHEHPPGYHSHGLGFKHTHNIDLVTSNRPSLWMLMALGVAGGLLPDPAALAILLSALAQGKMMLGLGTVVVFSLGFAATLVLVGVVASQVGTRILDWLAGAWAARLQIATSLIIIIVGVVLTRRATQLLAASA